MLLLIYRLLTRFSLSPLLHVLRWVSALSTYFVTLYLPNIVATFIRYLINTSQSVITRTELLSLVLSTAIKHIKITLHFISYFLNAQAYDWSKYWQDLLFVDCGRVTRPYVIWCRFYLMRGMCEILWFITRFVCRWFGKGGYKDVRTGHVVISWTWNMFKM